MKGKKEEELNSLLSKEWLSYMFSIFLKEVTLGDLRIAGNIEIAKICAEVTLETLKSGSFKANLHSSFIEKCEEVIKLNPAKFLKPNLSTICPLLSSIT